jgi:hypothetical protein
MKEIETYIKQYIEGYRDQMVLSAEEQKTIKFEGINRYIIQKINSTRFKGSSIPQELQSKIETIVDNAVKSSRPIHFTIPFGGFKNPQLSSYPNIDWSEIFNIVQMRDFAIEIAKGYGPGVIIRYFSDEVFVGRMNNMPQDDLDQYNNQLYAAIAYIQRFCPANVQLRYSKIRDEISQNEILKRFDQGIVELKKQWVTLPKEEQTKRIDKSRRNYRITDEKYTPEEFEQILFESTLVHDAFIFSDWEQGVQWAFAPDMIPIGNRYTNKWGIHLKSSPSSTAQFWVGFGVLERRADRYIPTILTYNQYLEKKAQLHYEKCSVLPETIIKNEIPVFTV